MATETQDLAGANRFLREVRLALCSAMVPGMPESLLETIPYACLEVLTGPGNALPAAAASGSLHVFVSGGPQIEALLAFGPEPDFDADLRAVVAATSERALRDVLLAFPGGHLGFFYVLGDWPLRAMEEVFDGQAMPAREGYCATVETFRPDRTREARRLSSFDYAVLREHWSEDVWREVLDQGYAVFACQDAGELQAFCFHWNVSPSRHEVHGLQGVKDFSARYAESVVSAATDHVLGIGSVATCTAVLSSEIEYGQAFERVGYRRFYRVDSFLGRKRGGPRFVAPSLDVFYRGRAAPRARAVELGRGLAATKRDPVTRLYRELGHPRARLERGRFVAEGITLVRRAIDDGLPVESVVYISDLLRTIEGIEVLEHARRAGIDHYRVSDALMGTLTTSRPLPRIIAAVHARTRDAAELWTSPQTSLLIAENIQNPDNLGMVLRTADAAGVEAVIVAGRNADPLHKNCVRAARGAVGRIPIFGSDNLSEWIEESRRRGLQVFGATARADTSLIERLLLPPLAVIVGNERSGVSEEVLDLCTERIMIPMAPGQESLNVGVATGVLLYELLRRRLQDPDC